jgi:hypothetical protein
MRAFPSDPVDIRGLTAGRAFARDPPNDPAEASPCGPFVHQETERFNVSVVSLLGATERPRLPRARNLAPDSLARELRQQCARRMLERLDVSPCVTSYCGGYRLAQSGVDRRDPRH